MSSVLGPASRSVSRVANTTYATTEVYAAATNATIMPVRDTPPSTPRFVRLNVVIRNTRGSTIPISLAAVSDAATAIAVTNMKLATSLGKGFEPASPFASISPTKLANAIAVGIPPLATMFLHVRSPPPPSWKPLDRFHSNLYFVAPKLETRNTRRSMSHSTLPKRPMIMPTTKADSEPDRSNIFL